jgi:UDP-glucose 4-epimerase
MKIIILGAASFIGTNLTLALLKNSNNQITLVDRNKMFFLPSFLNSSQIKIKESNFDEKTDFASLIDGNEIVYHLFSTSVPTTSNLNIPMEIQSNVVVSSLLFEACVRTKVKKIIFISSGGAVYGKIAHCPISEETPTYPISSYGIQKLAIEKLLYLYNYLFSIDYRIIRLSNPYGPYQRPNGKLGVITTFIYKAIQNQSLEVYGDGSVVRDFIYIDDAIKGIIQITNSTCLDKLFNLGSGEGTSINSIISLVKQEVNPALKVNYLPGRNADVPINYLNVSRYEKQFGKASTISLKEGILKTKAFLSQDLKGK